MEVLQSSWCLVSICYSVVAFIQAQPFDTSSKHTQYSVTNILNKSGSPPAQDTKLKPDSECSSVLVISRRAHLPCPEYFNLQSADVVGCASTIGNLLKLAGSESRLSVSMSKKGRCFSSRRSHSHSVSSWHAHRL